MTYTLDTFDCLVSGMASIYDTAMVLLENSSDDATGKPNVSETKLKRGLMQGKHTAAMPGSVFSLQAKVSRL